MEDVEQEELCTFHTLPRFCRRYVDDTCTVLPSDLVDSFHDHLNSVDPCIQFTMEKELDGQLPFLDILLSREDESIKTSVHRKVTHTDQYLCFHSHLPEASSGEDTDVQSIVPLFVKSESCSGREACVLGPRTGCPKGFIHQHTSPQPDRWTPRPGYLWICVSSLHQWTV